MGPLPEGAPELQSLVDRVLDPSAPREVVVAHGERTVVAGLGRDGRPVVVKVDRDPERPERETALLRALGGAGVAVPGVLAAERHVHPVDAHVLVLELIAGRPPGPDDPDEVWQAVGSGVRDLHDALPVEAAPPAFGHRDLTFADHLAGWVAPLQREGRRDGWLDDGQGERFAHLAEVAVVHSGPTRVLHGDCSPQHWLLSTGVGPRPIDLGDAGGGDPAWDLAVLTIEVPERLGAVLDGYRADRPLLRHVAATVPGLRVLRLAGSVSWLVEHGFDPTPEMGRLHAALA